MIGTVTVSPGVADISLGMLSDGLAGTGVAVEVGVDVDVGAGAEICTEPSSVSPFNWTPSSFENIAGGSDENPTRASSPLHDNPSISVSATSIIAPSGTAPNGRTVSARTMSISPSESLGSWVTRVAPNSVGTINFTESARPSEFLSVETKPKHVSS